MFPQPERRWQASARHYSWANQARVSTNDAVGKTSTFKCLRAHIAIAGTVARAKARGADGEKRYRIRRDSLRVNAHLAGNIVGLPCVLFRVGSRLKAHLFAPRPARCGTRSARRKREATPAKAAHSRGRTGDIRIPRSISLRLLRLCYRFGWYVRFRRIERAAQSSPSKNREWCSLKHDVIQSEIVAVFLRVLIDDVNIGKRVVAGVPNRLEHAPQIRRLRRGENGPDQFAVDAKLKFCRADFARRPMSKPTSKNSSW